MVFPLDPNYLTLQYSRNTEYSVLVILNVFGFFFVVIVVFFKLLKMCMIWQTTISEFLARLQY